MIRVGRHNALGGCAREEVVVIVVGIGCGVAARVGALGDVVAAVVSKGVLLPDQRGIAGEVAGGIVGIRLRELLLIELNAVVIAIVSRVMEVQVEPDRRICAGCDRTAARELPIVRICVKIDRRGIDRLTTV